MRNKDRSFVGGLRCTTLWVRVIESFARCRACPLVRGAVKGGAGRREWVAGEGFVSIRVMYSSGGEV